MAVKTAKCPRCPYKIRLNKNGFIMRHMLWSSRNGPFICDGSYMLPREPVLD